MATEAAAAAAAMATTASGLHTNGLTQGHCGFFAFARNASRISSSLWSARSPLRRLHIVCHSEPAGGCCGGSGSTGSSGTGSGTSSGSGSSCSSHGKDSLSNLGKEFEQLVAKNTLLEDEEHYVAGPMEGNITRDVMNSVRELDGGNEAVETEKCLDINEILRDAKKMSNGELVFSEDSDFVIV